MSGSNRAVARRWALAVALLGVITIGVGVGPASSAVQQIPTIGSLRVIAVPHLQTLQSIICTGDNHCLSAGQQQRSSKQSRIVMLTNRKPAGHVMSRSGSVVLGGTCTSVACLFVAKGRNHSGLIMAFKNGKLASTRVVRKVGSFEAITCEGTYRCFIVGRGMHNVAQLTAIEPTGAPIRTRAVNGAYDLDGVTCRPDGDCLAVGQTANHQPVEVPITDGSPDKAVVLLGRGTLTQVSCTGNAQCVAVGYTPSGQGLTVDSDPGAKTRHRTRTSSPLYGVDCFEASLCLVVGSSNGHGTAQLIYNREAQPQTTFNEANGFGDVDCSSVHLCYVTTSRKGTAAIGAIAIKGMTQPA